MKSEGYLWRLNQATIKDVIMRLFRIIHKSLAYDVKERPGVGALKVGNCAYLLTFDSYPMAILEHPFFNLVLGFPSSFFVAVYRVPDGSTKVIPIDRGYLYKENSFGNRQLGKWIKPFLESRSALVAEYASRDWNGQSNFVLNVRHPQFDHVVIEDVFSVR